MDPIQDSFTQRLLQRASLRRARVSNGDQKLSKEAMQRRYNIIQAINDPSIGSAAKFSCDDNNNNMSSFVVKTKLCNTLDLNDEFEIPVMESTRNIAQSDATKIPYSSPEQVISQTLNDTEIYDENNFLEDALGTELNNTSVTYDNSSAWDKSNSDFEASDLISHDEYSMEESIMEALTLTLSGVQPRSSSTLNRSMKLVQSVQEEMLIPNFERVSKVKTFFRSLPRFVQDFKKVMGFRASSKR